jgi:hypothetical protein
VTTTTNDGRHPPADDDDARAADPDDERRLARYLGRPLLFVFWTLAVWGTVTPSPAAPLDASSARREHDEHLWRASAECAVPEQPGINFDTGCVELLHCVAGPVWPR